VKGQSIKVTIANRVYPLTTSVEEEENIRKSVRLINKKIKEFEQRYEVQDTQDLLAMSALQFGVEKLRLENKSNEIDAQSERKIRNLIDLVEENL